MVVNIAFFLYKIKSFVWWHQISFVIWHLKNQSQFHFRQVGIINVNTVEFTPVLRWIVVEHSLFGFFKIWFFHLLWIILVDQKMITIFQIKIYFRFEKCPNVPSNKKYKVEKVSRSSTYTRFNIHLHLSSCWMKRNIGQVFTIFDLSTAIHLPCESVVDVVTRLSFHLTTAFE